MDQKLPSQVVKKKLISSSMLQPVKIMSTSGLPIPTNIASLESEIASISFSKNSSVVLPKQQSASLSNELNLSSHHFSSSLGQYVYVILTLFLSHWKHKFKLIDEDLKIYYRLPPSNIFSKGNAYFGSSLLCYTVVSYDITRFELGQQ